jgi:hypothetical protein
MELSTLAEVEVQCSGARKLTVDLTFDMSGIRWPVFGDHRHRARQTLMQSGALTSRHHENED